MNHRHALVRRCTVYHGHGEALSESCELPESPDEPARQLRTIADCVPLRQVMSTELVCARPDLDADAVIKLMIHHRVGCIPVVDSRRRPLGIITKFDLVEQVAAQPPADLTATKAEQVMMPLALTLNEHATVAHAASMMASEDTHHVLVVTSDGRLVGVVSTRDIVTWLVENDGTFFSERSAQASASWRPEGD